jgi:hypothetical protein
MNKIDIEVVDNEGECARLEILADDGQVVLAVERLIGEIPENIAPYNIIIGYETAQIQFGLNRTHVEAILEMMNELDHDASKRT